MLRKQKTVTQKNETVKMSGGETVPSKLSSASTSWNVNQQLQSGILGIDQLGNIAFSDTASRKMLKLDAAPNAMISIFDQVKDTRGFIELIHFLSAPRKSSCSIQLQLTFVTEESESVEVLANAFAIDSPGCAVLLVMTQVTSDDQASYPSIHPLAHNEEWEQSFNALPDHICILNKDGKILKANASMRDRFEPIHGPLEGLDYRLIYCGTANPDPDPPCARVLKGGSAVTLETSLPAVPGWFVVSSYPLDDIAGNRWGAVSVVKDVTERRQAQMELSQLFESSIDLICIMDLNGRLKRGNRSFCEYFGTHKPNSESGCDSHSTSILQHIHPDDVADFSERLNNVSRRVEIRGFRCRCLSLDGTYRWFSWNIPAATNDEDFLCAVARDVTDRETEAEILRIAKEEAEAASRAKTEFLAVVSHEMKTPLHSIAGAIELLERDSSGSVDRDLLATCRQSTELLKRLIKDVLTSSHLESGWMEVRPSQFKVRDLITRITQPFIRKATDLPFDFDVELTFDIPDQVFGDADRIGQIIINLLSNAFKFTEHGTIQLRLSVTPEDDDGTRSLEIAVSDTGPGIPADKLNDIFNMFEQGDSSSTRRHGGMGLGLWVCKQITKVMNGAIWAESTPHKGASFHVILPVLSWEQIEDARSGKTDLAPPDIPELNILFADDDDVGSIITSRMLTSKGHRVTRCRDGQEAIDAVSIEGAKFDLILTDIMMPKKDGIELTRFVRELSSPMSRIPIIAISAHESKSEVSRCRVAGVNDLIEKPFSYDELYRRISPYGLGKSSHAKPPVNLKDLYVRCNGDEGLIAELGSLFKKSSDASLDLLRRGCIKEDDSLFYQGVHKLKGTLKHLCATDALKLTDEMGIWPVNQSTIDNLLPKCEAEVERIHEFLSDIPTNRINSIENRVD